MLVIQFLQLVLKFSLERLRLLMKGLVQISLRIVCFCKFICYIHSPTQKELVFDMNGLLLNKYQYGESVPKCACYDFMKVFKGGKDLGTNCLVRLDVLDFLKEYGGIFQLCIWSNCSHTNIIFTLRHCLQRMHPHIWKEKLSQKEFVKLPFKL